MSSTDGLTARSVRSFGWELAARMAQRGVGLLATVVLARLLSPATYGVMGMAAVLVNFSGTFSQLGIPAAIVHRPDVKDEVISSLFWLNVAIGVAVTSLLVLMAPIAGAFFHEPLVQQVLPYLALTFAIASAGNVQHALFYRAMDLRRPAIAQSISSAAGLAVAISVALAGGGVWSLVLSSLASQAVDSLLMWIMHPWRPQVQIRREHLALTAGFGVNLSAFSLVNFFARNSDNVIIGRWLGSIQLGYYQNAYSLMYYPQQILVSLLSNVTLAPLSSIRHDSARFKTGIVRLSVIQAVVLCPAMLGLLVTSDLVVAVVLGSKWLMVAPILRILAIAGLIQSATACTGQVLTASGRTDVLFRLSLITTPIHIIAFAVGLKWGVRGVATAYIASTALAVCPVLVVALRTVGLSMREYWRGIIPILGCAFGMSVVVASLRVAMAALGFQSTPLILATSVVTGGITFGALIVLTWPAAVRESFKGLGGIVPLPVRNAAARVALWREARQR